jgi:hypothetical protein
LAQDQAQVVAGGAEQRMDSVANGALEVVARESAVELHVADHRLDRRAPPQLAPDRGRDPTPPAGDEHRGVAAYAVP